MKAQRPPPMKINQIKSSPRHNSVEMVECNTDFIVIIKENPIFNNDLAFRCVNLATKNIEINSKWILIVG